MENTPDLKEIIGMLSSKIGFEQRLLEKDYYLTRILHKIAERKFESLVFKGGTCLNKCYLGFYRLSEDLDFVYNRDISKFFANQTRKLFSELKNMFFDILESLNLKINKKLGDGWKMLTAKIPQKFIGLELIASYASFMDNSEQRVKIEISFRKKLIKPTIQKSIKHEFYNELNEPILLEGIKIECINLKENLAEKFRALITRKTIASRDLFDIYYILKNKLVEVDNELVELIISKINEAKTFTKQELINFIEHLSKEIVNEKELKTLTRTNEDVDAETIINLIKRDFKSS